MPSPHSYQLPDIEVFSMLEIDEVSTGPGLYAWYNLFAPGPPLWKPQLQGKKDLAPTRLRQALQRHTGRHSTHPLELEARGPFNTRWSGMLANTSDERWQQQLGTEPNDDDELNSELSLPFLQQALHNPGGREVLVRTLEAATPVFASPLYIGVAANLRTRLRQHKNQLYHSQNSGGIPTSDNDQPSEELTFAKRVAEKGFMLDDLRVYTLRLESFTSSELSTSLLRSTAEAAEWLLNRWHKPLLGRR